MIYAIIRFLKTGDRIYREIVHITVCFTIYAIIRFIKTGDHIYRETDSYVFSFFLILDRYNSLYSCIEHCFNISHQIIKSSFYNIIVHMTMNVSKQTFFLELGLKITCNTIQAKLSIPLKYLVKTKIFISLILAIKHTIKSYY